MMNTMINNKLNIVGQHALHLGRVFCIYEHSVNRQYVMTSGFVDSWIYLYTTDRQIKW